MSFGLAVVGTVTFTGRNGTGSLSVPGLKVGDNISVTHVVGTPGDPITPGSAFDDVVSVDDEIHQRNSGDLSTSTFVTFFFRSA